MRLIQFTTRPSPRVLILTSFIVGLSLAGLALGDSVTRESEGEEGIAPMNKDAEENEGEKDALPADWKVSDIQKLIKQLKKDRKISVDEIKKIVFDGKGKIFVTTEDSRGNEFWGNVISLKQTKTGWVIVEIAAYLT